MNNKYLFSIMIFFILTANSFSFIDLSKVGRKLEKNARTADDFNKVVEIYSKYLQHSSPSDSKENKARVQHSIAVIYEKNLKRYKDAAVEYKKVIKSYPQSLYAKKSEEGLQRISLLESKSRFIPETPKKNMGTGPLIIPYDPQKLTSDHIEKVSIDKVKNAMLKAKRLEEEQQYLTEFNPGNESGLEYLQDLFSMLGIADDLFEDTSYRISIENKDQADKKLKIQAGMSVDSRFLSINDTVGIRIESEKEILFFPRQKLQHVISETSPRQIIDLYRNIIDRYSGLMYLNGNTEYLWVAIVDPADEEAESTSEDRISLDFIPLSEEHSNFMEMDLDFSLGPFFIPEIRILQRVPAAAESDEEDIPDEPVAEVKGQFNVTELLLAPTSIPDIDSFKPTDALPENLPSELW